jgi:hypothetical protein
MGFAVVRLGEGFPHPEPESPAPRALPRLPGVACRLLYCSGWMVPETYLMVLEQPQDEVL